MANNKRHRYLQSMTVLAALILAAGSPVFGQEENTDAAEPAAPDTSNWACSSCPFNYGLSGDVVFGLGHVSDDFYEFGNFGGIEDDGIFGVLGLDLLYRTEDGRYLDVYAERLGLDSRSVLIEGGRQGSYELTFEYDGIPWFRADDARTVFNGAGTASQTLPSDWVFADTTGRMSALRGSLRGVDVEQDRETVGVGLAIDRPDPWRFTLDVEQTTRDGSLVKGASFVYRAAELVAPVDYETTRVEAAVGYVQDTWQLEAAYNLSLFDNGNDSLRWQNPFSTFNGAVLGELAESPDSQSHQLMLSGSWRLPNWLTVAGQVAVARLEQDEPYVAPTLNSNLAFADLPRNNLDGEVTTRVANLRVTGDLTDRLGAKVGFRYDERDNETPRDAYQQIITDVYVTGFRTNEPYSYERQSLEAALDYRLLSNLKLMASAEHEEMERSFQETEDTDTDLYSLQARSTPISGLNLNLKLSREERDNDIDPALLGPQVNPDLRRFHYADRDRDSLRFTADYALRDNLVAGVFAEVSDEEYRDTRVGLSDARSESYGLDLSAIFSESVSAHAFVAVERLDADIAGADIFDPGDLSGTPWRGEQNDDFQTAGFGVEFRELPGKWVRGAIDVIYASADGEIRLEKEEGAPAFPELETSRYSLEASVERILRENMNLGLSYVVARRDEIDFYRDNVDPDTAPDLLGLGRTTPDEMVHVIRVMLRYRF